MFEYLVKFMIAIFSQTMSYPADFKPGRGVVVHDLSGSSMWAEGEIQGVLAREFEERHPEIKRMRLEGMSRSEKGGEESGGKDKEGRSKRV